MPILLLVIGMPFLLGVIQHIIQRSNERINMGWFASSIMSVSFMLLLCIAYDPVIVRQGASIYTLEWLPDYGLHLSFYLDSLSLLFGLIITGIGTIVFLYSGYYFDETGERNRFIRLLLLFTGSMLWLVLSNNLITLFIAWELTSIISFLLIGFKGDKYASAREGATRALVVTGGGGLALLVGLLALGAAGGSYEFSDLLTLELTDHAWYVPLTLLLLLGAFTKSAQFPFHFWLPGAMDAPTPASAFLHSATMVKAGVYLLARLHPMLGDTLFWNNALMAVGLTTMLFSAVVAVRQPDLKGLLAFTTTGKLGALIALLGVPGGYGVKAALVGILAHALYKSALFLSVGNIDHATGTRLINKLGGLWKNMPITGIVVIVSSLSMVGLPPLLGFVTKETMLEAFVFDPVLLGIVFIGAALTATAGYILIWDVFFGKAKEEVHVHALHKPLEMGLLVLALATVIFALFVTQLLQPLLAPLIPVEFKLVLFPGFNEIFFLSVAAIATGFALFFLRDLWRRVPEFSFNTIKVYDRLIFGAEWVADQVLKTQNGLLRHYLIVIISVVITILVYGGLVQDIFSMPSVEFGTFTLPDLLDVMLLVLAVGAAYASVRVRQHLNAALALAIFGYAIGGVFFVEPAPDVALVMILVETLATVVLIIMIGRISAKQRAKAMEALDRNFKNRTDAFASIRDITIAVITGVSMFAFALIALVNRDNRNSIAIWHLDNAQPEVGVTDVVSAILTDFRGTDTLIEIAVFATAALGLLALLTINRKTGGEPGDPVEVAPAKISILTPMIQVVASLVFPLTLMISTVHILYGANAPGDGFTAGIVSGLGIALYYVVFGYDYVSQHFRWLRPTRFVLFGLALALVNAVIPVLSGGSFMGLVDFAPGLDFANLKFNTTVVFEVAIAVTVFGGVSLIMEAIAHPTQVPFPNEARRAITSEIPGIVQQSESEFEKT